MPLNPSKGPSRSRKGAEVEGELRAAGQVGDATKVGAGWEPARKEQGLLLVPLSNLGQRLGLSPHSIGLLSPWIPMG